MRRLGWLLVLAAVVGCSGEVKVEKKAAGEPSHDAIQNRQINRNGLRIEVLEAKVARLAEAQGIELDPLPVEPVESEALPEEEP